MYPQLQQENNQQSVSYYQQLPQQYDQKVPITTSPHFYQQNPPLQQQPPLIIDSTAHEPLIATQAINNVNYDANAYNPKTTKLIKFGSILLFIGTFFITAFLLGDIIGGATYQVYPYVNQPVKVRNPLSAIVAKTLLMLINLVLMIASGVLGIISTRDGTSVKSKYSLLHVICLSIGMIVFVSDMIIVHVSFFTTDYELLQPGTYGPNFLAVLITFTVLSLCAFVGCCACCVSGCVRYRNISAHTKEVSI